MNHVLAKSFVVTIALAPGCARRETGTANPPPPPTATATAIATGTPTATATAPPTATERDTKKRKRTSDAHPWNPANAIPPDLVPMQPKDAGGRLVYVASDDRCYYEEPMKPPYPPMPTGARAVSMTYVDCPAAFDDPAWDGCSNGTLSRSSSGECFCVMLGGNPPPPPLKNACPK